ncbi:uncharacterized protein NEMAJ01_2267 [Nematocida major]|uniref:uncharacterized protein n=1 Tax=Nematocida major TaxID=1912982 RepID=UPI0020077241|nr:uncharacterized protein NEMAJ01_2267 [Nematocida major]KAH9387371.1 hypothetical protein NEMAJ01_2267 [Nematocida major]
MAGHTLQTSRKKQALLCIGVLLAVVCAVGVCIFVYKHMDGGALSGAYGKEQALLGAGAGESQDSKAALHELVECLYAGDGQNAARFWADITKQTKSLENAEKKQVETERTHPMSFMMAVFCVVGVWNGERLGSEKKGTSSLLAALEEPTERLGADAVQPAEQIETERPCNAKLEACIRRLVECIEEEQRKNTKQVGVNYGVKMQGMGQVESEGAQRAEEPGSAKRKRAKPVSGLHGHSERLGLEKTQAVPEEESKEEASVETESEGLCKKKLCRETLV